MKLSIIIPCLNLEKYISKLLDTLVAQTFKDFKVICVLDDCTDDTENVIKTYQNKLNIEIYSGSWHRAGLARNFGLEKADTEWIWFLDGDDWLLKDTAIEEIFNKINSLPSDLEALRFKYSNSYDIKHAYYMQCIWNWVIKREALIKNNLKFDNAQIAEDCLLSCQVLMLLKNYLWENEECYHFYNYPRDGSTRSKLEHKSNIYVVYPGLGATTFCQKHTNWFDLDITKYQTLNKIKTKITTMLNKGKKILITARPDIIGLLYSMGLPVNLLMPLNSDNTELYQQLRQAKNDVYFDVPEGKYVENVLGFQFNPGSVGFGHNYERN